MAAELLAYRPLPLFGSQLGPAFWTVPCGRKFFQPSTASLRQEGGIVEAQLDGGFNAL